MSEGDAFVALDGSGTAWVAEIVSCNLPEAARGRRGHPGEGASVTGRITGEAGLAPEPSCKVTLYQSIPKGDKMEFIIQKCTEVGVHSIVPVVSERTVVHLGDRVENRVERWRRIAREAAEQCGRRVIPEVAGVSALGDVTPGPGSALFILWENAGGERRLLEALDMDSRDSGGGRVGVVVGPEGGLSDREVDSLRARGGICVSLGPRTLRTETAGMIATALILSHYGDLG